MRSAVALLLLLASACEREPPQGELIEGEAAGATFLVRLAERLPESERAEVERIVSDTLERVSSRASSSLPESDLSRLHRAAAGVETPVSVETFEMVREAVRVSELTGGAFDVTVAPLARLWGFGPGVSVSSAPTEEEIERERARVGFRNLVLDDDSMTIAKRIESLEIDLSGIATGYALAVPWLLGGSGPPGGPAQVLDLGAAGFAHPDVIANAKHRGRRDGDNRLPNRLGSVERGAAERLPLLACRVLAQD